MSPDRKRTAGKLNRRHFIRATSLALGSGELVRCGLMKGWAGEMAGGKQASRTAAELPRGSGPKPVPFPHFPDRLHAFVWRNWQLVPARQMAEVVGGGTSDIVRLGRNMGLAGPPRITAEQQRRSALTIIRRNWHLRSYEQLLQLLGWTAEQMALTLREDDFLFVKFGNANPRCEPLKYQAPAADALEREHEMARTLRSELPQGAGQLDEPLFEFVKELSQPPKAPPIPAAGASVFSPRFCYSYFALYGDPLLDPALDPYPEGYLARLAGSGVDGVWLQAVLSRLAPFPWDARQSQHYETRLKNLRSLVERARRHGIGVHLYLNELGAGEAAALHFRSMANQARFIMARRRLKEARSRAEVESVCAELERVLHAEMESARRLHALQTRDSRIGFQASNQSYCVPVDLAEKIINCHYRLGHWLPTQRDHA